MNNQQLIRPDKAGVIIFPPLLFACALAAGVVIGYVIPTHLFTSKLAILIASSLFIIACAVLISAVKTLAKYKTTINPSGVTTTIVRDGIYKHTRNPMYVAFTLIYVSAMIGTNSWYGLMLLVPLLVVVQKGIIEKEEKYLGHKFGEEYLSYRKAGRRWI